MTQQLQNSIIIIGLIGDNRTGKDTFASYLNIHNNFKHLAFADPIKEVSKILFDFTDNQLYNDEKDIIDERWGFAPREFFQQFGTEIMQKDIYNYIPGLKVKPKNFWAERLVREIENDIIKKQQYNFIITDIRFNHELETLYTFIDAMKSKAQNEIIFKTIKIEKPKQEPIKTSKLTHESQLQVNNLTADITILNDADYSSYIVKIKDVIKTLGLFITS